MIRHKNELRSQKKFMCVSYILNFTNKIYKYNLSKCIENTHTHTLNIISNVSIVFHFSMLFIWH